MIVRQELPLNSDVDDFDDFYRRERVPLTRLAHLLTGSPVIGEELAQEALVAVHGRWASLDNPAGYARRALVNMAKSYHRRRALERRHARSDRYSPSLPPEIDEMWSAIRRLSVAQRAVVVLRYYEDLSLEDIARTLDQPLGTVKSSLHRALARLKEVLA